MGPVHAFITGSWRFQHLFCLAATLIEQPSANWRIPIKRILITGGAGFVGCNAARFFRARNWGVTVLDNLSRRGADKNLEWLRSGTSFDFEHADVRDRANVDRLFSEQRFDAVLHLAAQ